jgi:hypothetical protein
MVSGGLLVAAFAAVAAFALLVLARLVRISGTGRGGTGRQKAGPGD